MISNHRRINCPREMLPVILPMESRFSNGMAGSYSNGNVNMTQASTLIPSTGLVNCLPPICTLGTATNNCIGNFYTQSAHSLAAGHLYSILQQKLIESYMMRPSELILGASMQHAALNDLLVRPGVSNSHDWNTPQRNYPEQFHILNRNYDSNCPTYPCWGRAEIFESHSDLSSPTSTNEQGPIRTIDAQYKEKTRLDLNDDRANSSKRRKLDDVPDERARSPRMKGDEPADAAPSGKRSATVRWTRAEHEQFLEGLERFGVGQWCSIARLCVPTRSATQVASHHQKFALRSSLPPERRHKASVLDETTPRVQSLIQASRTSSDASV